MSFAPNKHSTRKQQIPQYLKNDSPAVEYFDASDATSSTGTPATPGGDSSSGGIDGYSNTQLLEYAIGAIVLYFVVMSVMRQ